MGAGGEAERALVGPSDAGSGGGSGESSRLLLVEDDVVSRGCRLLLEPEKGMPR